MIALLALLLACSSTPPDLKTAIKLMGKHQLGKEITDLQASEIEIWLGSTTALIE